MRIVVVGAGAAGFFSALAAKEKNPEAKVVIIERSANILSKVRISGGGRCNVTHACFDPQLLVQHYPRGHKELLGPFHRFQPRDTIEWFKARGVPTIGEEDGRIFPLSNSSATIVDCFLRESHRLGVEILTQTPLKAIRKVEDGFELARNSGSPLFADRVILAMGSSREGYDIAKSLGHTIKTPVPSLFTLKIPSFSLVKLAGVTVNPARLRIAETKLEQQGALLITHSGFTGPAPLKLSAFGARWLAEKDYEATLLLDWLPEMPEVQIREFLVKGKASHPTTHLGNFSIGGLPKSLWHELCKGTDLSLNTPLNTLSNAALSKLIQKIKRDDYQVRGKTPNKEEFVTCGGVSLSEVDFRGMESKLCPHLFFCGEILDIDGVTGGFNFQNAWTTGWIAGRSAVSKS